MSPAPVPDAPAAPVFEDRLLAEAVRFLEEERERRGEAPIEDPEAVAGARAIPGGFEARIVQRARRLPVARALREELRRLHAVARWAAAGGGLLMFVAGVGATAAVLGGGREATANPFSVLLALLGVQSFMLLVWALMAAWPRRGQTRGGLLAKGVAGLWQRLARGKRSGGARRASVAAAGSVLFQGRPGVWLLSTATHGLWTCFNIACLGALLLWFSVRHYEFAWETTLLSDGAFVWMTGVLAAVPEALGLPVPSAEQIAATRYPGEAAALAEARQAWAWLVLAWIASYGLLPRLLLLGFASWRLRAALRAFRLDTELPEHARLAARLQPVAGGDETMTHEEGRPPEPLPPVGPRPEGPPAILGLEISLPASGVWPPAAPGIRWRDLGLVDGRERRHEVLRSLMDTPERPSQMVVACHLAATPDRGVAGFLQDVAHASGNALALLLTGGQMLRDRGEGVQVERRLRQWHELAERAGIPSQRVLELDLDHATTASLGRLAALVGGGEASKPAPPRRLGEAFEKILAHRKRWTEPPGTEAQADLHKEVAVLYRGEPGGLGLLGPALSFRGDWRGQLASGAQRLQNLLPARLLLRPRWAAAGALAGALGCVAASVLLTPAAALALPSWSLIGAAVGNFLPGGGKKPTAAGEEGGPPDFAAAVDAAALLAMVLELQGSGEAAITRVLDRVLPGEEEADRALRTVDEARAHLEDLRGRFNAAVAREGLA